jgi:hypothetical protein
MGTGALVGCSRDTRAPVAAPPPAPVLAWQYDVRGMGAGIDEISVEALFGPGGSDEMGVDDDAAPFVRDVAYASAAGGWVPVTARGPVWTVPCASRGCRVRYRFGLGEAARKLDDPEVAIASGDAVVAPPSTWLLHPAPDDSGAPARRRLRFQVHVATPLRFVAGMRPAPDGEADAFEADTADLESSSFAVFGSFDLETIRSDAARVDVAIVRSALALSNPEVVAWVRTAVDGIAAYYGRFPVDRTLVVVQAGRPDSPTRGATLGDGGPAVLVRAGSKVTGATTRDDWVVTHELLHVSLPSLSREHEWLGEGVATYVEPIVRARAGLVTAEKFWGDLVEGLPQGLPERGDQGLERTHTWGRTYWGGALFCLMADLFIRERTKNQRSFDDALRGIVATGADVEAHWTIERFIEVGDRATGTRALHDLYREMALAPGTVDLPSVWARLGVRTERDRILFDDNAPLAAIRRAITASRRTP